MARKKRRRKPKIRPPQSRAHVLVWGKKEHAIRDADDTAIRGRSDTP